MPVNAMASALRSRMCHTVVASLLAVALGMPVGAARVAHADPEPPVADTACEDAAAEPGLEPVRFRFWIGAFEFSLAIGGQAGFMLAFEGLR
jgi:hypothetical protein